MTILVFPDSNAAFDDPFFERPTLRTILAAEGYADVRLMLPKLVLDELRGQVGRQGFEPWTPRLKVWSSARLS